MPPPRRSPGSACRALLLAGMVLAGLVLAAPRPALACDPGLIDALLAEADGHLGFAVRAGDLAAARGALRRVATTLNDAEAQMISCGCLNAQAEARRAAAATDYETLVVAFEAAISAFELTLAALEDDYCR